MNTFRVPALPEVISGIVSAFLVFMPRSVGWTFQAVSVLVLEPLRRREEVLVEFKWQGLLL